MGVTSSGRTYSAFISYNSRDRKVVTALADRLRANGIEVFLDTWHLSPGELPQEALEVAMERSAGCVVMVGPHGIGQWQNEEIRIAIERRVSDPTFSVVPVLLPGAPNGEDTLPPFLRRSSICDFRTGLDDKSTLSRLVTALGNPQDPGSGTVRAHPTAMPSKSEHRSVLGIPAGGWPRRSMIDEVLRRVESGWRSVVLQGLSGTGKTTLLCDVADELAHERDVLTFRLSGAAKLEPLYVVETTKLALEGAETDRPATGRAPWREVLTRLLAERTGRELVVLLDDVEPTAATELLEVFTTAPHVLVIATSRSQLPPELRVFTVPVRPLTHDESAELIGHQISSLGLQVTQEQVTRALPASVLSHPHALCAFLAHTRHIPIGLLTHHDLPDDVSDPLRVVADSLSGLAPGDRVTLALVDALGGAPLSAFRRVTDLFPRGFAESVRRLVDLSLVHIAGDGIDVPELVSEALIRVAADARRGATTTVADGLRTLVGIVDPAVEADLAAILPPIAMVWAAREDWEVLDECVTPELLERLNQRGHWKEYVLLARLRIAAMDSQGDLLTRIESRCRLARKVAQMGDMTAALALVHEADRTLGEHNRPELRADVHSHRSLLAYWQNDDALALRELQTSVELSAASGDTQRLLVALKLNGNIRLRQQDYENAATAYQKALELDGVHMDSKHRLEAEASLAVCEMRLGHEKRAEERLERTVSRMRSLRMNSELPRALYYQALLVEQQGRPAEALDLARNGAALPSHDDKVQAAVSNLVKRLERFPRARTPEGVPRPSNVRPSKKNLAGWLAKIRRFVSRDARLAWKLRVRSGLPGYLIRSVIRVAPAGITTDTTRVLAEYIAEHQLDAGRSHLGTTNFRSLLEASLLGKQLIDRWTTDGGHSADLDKLVAMIDYRMNVLHPHPFQQDERDAKTDPEKLERFWIASGHDLTELAAFLAAVDRENMDLLPG
ncbi:TIR domain-containing protein [Saccharopolyspora shandongensis]|uniref:TIR domain-containing protein n=1 Tax=Saccharopolyspora shandongensis TaxID=418495 RepID=UPI003435B49A